MKNMERVVKVNYLDDYKVQLNFEDGFESTVDLRPLLGKGITIPLLDREEFKKVGIEEGGGLAWESGFDLCPNQLRLLAEQSKSLNAAS